jgi:Uma2 family endonuclease
LAVTAPPALAAPGEGPRRWKWTGDDLIRLGALGVLPADRKFELLDGAIIESMPPGPRHDMVVSIVADCLGRLSWKIASHTRQEKAVRLDPHYDPRPDVSQVRGIARDYQDRFPSVPEVLLFVEVADTSLALDRGEKLRAYAAAGIADYWIVNLQADQVEVYREPDADCYRSIRVYKLGEKVTPLEAPDAELPVNVLLGRE